MWLWLNGFITGSIPGFLYGTYLMYEHLTSKYELRERTKENP